MEEVGESLKLVSEVKTHPDQKKPPIRRERVILLIADWGLHLCRQLSLT